MKSPVLSKFFLLIALLCLVFAPSQANALEVGNLRFGTYSDKTRLVVELSQSADYRLFVLAEPTRMVLDLPSFEWTAKPANTNSQAGIKAIRHGNLKPGISRIVFDLNRPIAIQNAFTLPRADGKPPRLVIDFNQTNANGFKAAQSKIFGALNVDGVKTASASTKAPPRPAPAAKAPTQKPPTQKPLIIIDPGHGGIDPGALGPGGIHEKTVVLALGKELKRQLEKSGKYRVKMTRYDDTFVKLGDRVKFARKHQGDLFVSVHADSAGNKNVSGASFYTLSEKASDAQAAKLAARENKSDLIAGIELDVEDSAVVDILIDLARRNTQNQSKYIANIFVNDFKRSGLKTLKSANRHANFAVLKAPDIPSILVETGFMSNRKEAKKLNTSAHRRKVATSLRKGIDAYFKTVKENERS